MPAVKISIKSNARDKLGKLVKSVSAKVEKETKALLKETSEEIVRIMKKYPPKRPNQKYVRTNTLKNSWKIVSKPKKLSARTSNLSIQIKSDARQKGRSYTKYVVGDEKGNWQNQKYHAGRWKLFVVVVAAQMKKLRKKVTEKIKLKIGRKSV